ncbi:MAG: GNAT family N-acetyltransferase [Bacteroidota bacterium]
MKKITETERFYLREFILNDAEHFFNMNNDEDVIRFTSDKPFESLEVARNFLNNYDAYKKHGMGRWAVCLKSSGKFLGWCGLKYHANKDIVEIGYRFYQKHWGNGYATEACKACINYGFENLNLKTIYAHSHINNLNSHRVVVKCELSFVKFEN